MTVLYRWNCEYGTGYWIENKGLAEQYLEGAKDDYLEYFELGDTICLESLNLYDIDQETEPEDKAKTIKTWIYTVDEAAMQELGEPRKMGFDFDFYAKWSEVTSPEVVE